MKIPSYSRYLFTRILLCFLAVLPPGRVFGEWQWRNPIPQGDLLSSVAYGDRGFVAVGVGGLALESFDSKTWTVTDSAFRGDGAMVAFGNGYYVTVGSDRGLGVNGGFILASSDGINWSAVLKNCPTFGSVSFENNRFFATFFGGAILSSFDGQEWQETRPNQGSDTMSNVTFGTGYFVAVHGTGIVKSTDGIAWADGVKIRDDGIFRSIAFGNGSFVAVGDSFGHPIIYSSTDLITWMPRNTATESILYSARFGGGSFVAVGDNGAIERSEDGVNWTTISAGVSENLRGVAFGNGKFVIVGDLGVILTSIDGKSWLPQRKGSLASLSAVAHANTLYVAVGSSFERANQAAVLTSTDAVAWKEENLDGIPPLYAVVALQDKFIAVGEAGMILTGPSQWRIAESPATNRLRAVTAGSDQLVVAGENGSILTSSDTLKWTSHNYPDTNVNVWAITYGNARYVAVGHRKGTAVDGISLTSTDGHEWSLTEIEPGIPLFTVAYGNGRFVAGGAFRLFTSTNGINWERAQTSRPDIYPRAVAFSGKRFVAVGERVTLTSVDGRQWTEEPSLTIKSLLGMTYADGSFVAVGSDGTIIQSQSPLTLSLANPRMQGSDFFFSVIGIAGQPYELQISPGVFPSNWVTIREGIWAQGITTFLQTNAATRVQSFYRIRQPR